MSGRTLVYDCFSGISGDMHIGAMLELGVSETALREALDRLELGDEFTLEVCRDAKMGITGTRATVRLTDATGHHHRHLQDIREIICAAGYPAAVETMALTIFQHIAEAEAKIHDMPVDAVHFHEVGAVDSIVDIVAAAVCLNELDVRHVCCSTLELGGGMVRCAHGMLPVPAPATAEILTGVPCRYGGVNQEATTPTGAAILKTVVGEFGPPENFVAERVGYGIGQKDFEIPNVLRVMLGRLEQRPVEDSPRENLQTERNQEIECNIDDMPAEAFQPLVERLLAAGAKDVFLTPIIMKKARPATRVSVLCAPEDTMRLTELLFTNSTTIGVRTHEVTKLMLPREEVHLKTSLGAVAVKIVIQPDGIRRWKLAHDDLVRIAAASARSYLEVSRILTAEVGALLDGEAATP